MTKIIRQGDLLIRKVRDLPEDARKKKTNILALGEATGHSHKLNPVKGKTHIYENDNGEMLFEVEEKATLDHQEHKPIQIDKGIYKVTKEREYNPFATSNKKSMRIGKSNTRIGKIQEVSD